MWIEMLTGTAVKSTVLLLAAWGAARLLRRHSAAARHLVWTGAAAALVALPFFVISLPRVPAGAPLPVLPSLAFRAEAPAVSAAQAAAPARSAATAGVAVPKMWRPDLGLSIAAAWGSGSAFVLVQLAWAWIAMARIRRSAVPREPAGAVPVFETGAIGMPVTCGLLRPAILLPAGAREWAPERLRMALLHESAHVERGDVATQSMARLACALYWWNPLVWMAWREFLKERERAADDAVLAGGLRASDYAGLLLEMAQAPETAVAASVPMARKSQLEGRLTAILDSGVRRGALGRRAQWAAVAAAVVLAVPFGAVRAQAPAHTAVPDDVQATIRTATAQKDPAMLDRAAEACEAHRELASARAFREAALALHREISGEDSGPYQAELASLGALAGRISNAFKETESYYNKAAALTDRNESAPSLLFLGMRAYGERRDAEAARFLERALNVSRKEDDVAAALTWQAMVSARAGDANRAETLFRRALDQGSNTPAAVTAAELFASFLREQNRAAEAQPFEEQAQAYRKKRVAELSPARSSSEQPSRAGGGTTAPALAAKVEPSYSEAARSAKVQGTVVLTVVVEPDGHAAEVRLAKGVGLGLDEMAEDAVAQWKFKPGAKNGEAVPIAATIEVNFRLM